MSDLAAMLADDIENDIRDERRRQDEKWGDQSGHPDALWITILVEEVGEAAQDVLRATGLARGPERTAHEAHLRMELVQCAAVIKAWITALDDAALAESGGTE